MRIPSSHRGRFWFILFTTLLTISTSHGVSRSQAQKQKTYIYSFKYLGMTVAHGAITISDTLTDDGLRVEYIRTSATSLPATSVLFKIHNSYFTLIDSVTGFPILYHKAIEQSNLSEDIHFRFDQENLRVHSAQGEEFSLSAPTHNFFSALYVMMNHTFQPKEVLRLPVYAAGNIWEVKAKAVQTEKIVTSTGTYPTVRVEIEFSRSPEFKRPTKKTDVLTNRLLNEGVRTYLWLSAAENGVVAKAEYELFPARLQMILVECHK